MVDCGCTCDLAIAPHEVEGEVEHPFAFVFCVGHGGGGGRRVIPVIGESPGIERCFEQRSEGEVCMDRKRGMTAREGGTWKESCHLGSSGTAQVPRESGDEHNVNLVSQ